jgi:histidyl-tRNA synthetase
VSENDQRTSEAVALAAQLRRAGFAAELVASGSAKKRYSRAMALSPLTAISLDVRDGVRTQGLRVISADTDSAADIQAAYERISLTLFSAP